VCVRMCVCGGVGVGLWVYREGETLTVPASCKKEGVEAGVSLL